MNRIFIPFLCLSCLAITGCNKIGGEISGCTSPQSLNYNPRATINDGSCCEADTVFHIASYNYYDFNPSSFYYTSAIANFKFTQTSVNYSGTSCSILNYPIQSCNVDLAIQNLINKTIIFSYQVNFQLNYSSWQYSGNANIPPGGILNIPGISDNCAEINLGSFQLNGGLISYQ